MIKKSASQSAFLNPRVLVSFGFCSVGVFLVLMALDLFPGTAVLAKESESHQAAGPHTITPLPNATTVGQLIISEFRVRGPNGANDEFIDLYNTTGAQLTAQSADGSSGLAVASSDAVIRCVVPNGTMIPAGGHFLCANSVGYSLGSYPSGSGTTATGNQTYATDIPDQAGVALFNNSTGGPNFSLGNRLDAAGPSGEANAVYREGAGLPPLTPFSIDASWVRRLPGGCTGSGSGNCNSVSAITTTAGPTSTQPQDTDDNAADFIFVDTNGTSAGGGQRLGAPAPQNLAGPGAVAGTANTVFTTLDACSAETATPNYVRDTTSDPANNSTFGTVDLRKTFTNNSGAFITRLRFRVVDITTFPSISGVADLRPRNTGDILVTVDRPPCTLGTSNLIVRGTTLEQPPSQPNGGGYNSSLSVNTVTEGTPLATGDSIDVRFLLGVQQNGVARFCVASETVPATASEVSCFTPVDITPGAIPTPTPCGTGFSENFDGVTAPALPTGWVASNAQGSAPLWVTTTTTPDSAPNDVFVDDPASVSDKRLDSTNIAIGSSSAQVSFRNNFTLESGFDGGVLEVSSPNIAGGAFTDITNPAVGGSFVSGGYNSAISTNFGSPIGGRMAWSGNPGGYIDTIANLGPNVAGQTIKLRFRMASDTSVSSAGWRFDTVTITEVGENFDAVVAPNLPAGWAASNAQGPAPLWVTTTTTPDSPPNDVFVDDPDIISDKRLDTPDFVVNSAAAQVTFRNNFTLESTFDGGVLEVSSPNIAGGTFTDITNPAVGGNFVLGGYNSTISANFGSPIAGRMAWSGNSGGYITSVANLGPNVVGQTIKLRFRMASDSSVSSAGWRFDTVVITGAAGGGCATALNISTRMRVQAGDNILIGGFIVTGNAPKYIILRGIGPSLGALGVPGALADPTLELRSGGGTLLAQNDNWQDDPSQSAQLTATGLAPSNPLESGIAAVLQPGASYTAALAGKNGGTGVGLVEAYDFNNTADSQLANISTRGFVEAGDNVMIGGFILGGSGTTQVVLRGIGPSLAQFGLNPVLMDPTLELHDGNGATLFTNDNWQDDPAQAAQLTSVGLAPQDPAEAAIIQSLPPGAFTAVVAGKNGGTGIGLVEVYNVH